MAESPQAFDPGELAGLGEPVQRYFSHAIAEGAPLVAGVRVTMRGRIRVRRWLRFTAEQHCDGQSFAWRARVGWGPFRPLTVVDRFAAGAGSMDGGLLGLRLFHASGADITRSSAGRAALESVLAPASLLPGRGVTWRAESDTAIVASWDLPPERPEVHLEIDDHGAVRSVSAQRWGDVGEESYGYIPCGAEVHAERRFGGLVVPSSLTVGWWFGTERWEPFFEAEIHRLEPLV